MVLQEVPLQVNAATVEVSSAFVPEAALPAFDFASAFSGSSAGFAPTSILIELFGAFAFPGTSDPIASALLLGLSGHRPGNSPQQQQPLSSAGSSPPKPFISTAPSPFPSSPPSIWS